MIKDDYGDNEPHVVQKIHCAKCHDKFETIRWLRRDGSLKREYMRLCDRCRKYVTKISRFTRVDTIL